MDTIATEDVKFFAIYGEIETTMKTRVLHVEPGTIGFNSFTPAEYLEEMLGRFMNSRTKGGAKEEIEQRKQRVNEEEFKQLYLHAYDEGKRNIQEFKRLTLNGLRKIEMLKSCWNKLSKRTIKWGEIRPGSHRSQLTVQKHESTP